VLQKVKKQHYLRKAIQKPVFSNFVPVLPNKKVQNYKDFLHVFSVNISGENIGFSQNIYIDGAS
jgi:hypothetical protein